ncbi:MAG TPA: hypothetical protein VF165_20180 [Nocardioidaceae bacterium]
MELWRVKAAANVVNGSTLLGVAVAAVGRARLERGPRGLVLATGYALPFPVAGAFTLGNVVLTRHDRGWWLGQERVLAHEERHSWQYVATLGLPFLPLYVLAAGWSFLRGGDWSTYNVFERRAGLADGGYPLVSRRQRRRPPRTA